MVVDQPRPRRHFRTVDSANHLKLVFVAVDAVAACSRVVTTTFLKVAVAWQRSRLFIGEARQHNFRSLPLAYRFGLLAAAPQLLHPAINNYSTSQYYGKGRWLSDS